MWLLKSRSTLLILFGFLWRMWRASRVSNRGALPQRSSGSSTSSTATSGGSQSEQPPLLDLYKIAVDEYRFQANLNWGRTLHWFTLNTALAGAAIALFHVATGGLTYLLVGAIFFCGAAACFVAVHGIRAQHEYYRAARDHMKDLEKAMGVAAPLGLATTPGMGSGRKRRIRLQTLYVALFLLLMALDLGGAAFALYEWNKARPPHATHVKKQTTTMPTTGTTKPSS